ncbi:hypothetical protein Fcan01_15806 [Folsomia candida]|uniref:Uncharacterized protein n=1 Tax=Folsomia candida TaxID=158441 RepID=A0A226DV91_FOLCA|nr:hypothetical protein Fcan01_15806 [Folsomia candida]
MTSDSIEITEFFGVILAYAEIMEKSFLFGKCPMQWDPKNHVARLDWGFLRCFKFWVKIVTSFLFLFLPVFSIQLRFLVNKLSILGTFEDNVPLTVVSPYFACSARVAEISLVVHKSHLSEK